MKNTVKNTIKTSLIASVALLFIINLSFAKTASADYNFGFGDAGFGDSSSYSYDEYFPEYSYDTYTPDYSYDSYYPSYDYSSYGNYGGYSYTPSYGYSYSQPYTYTPSPSYQYVYYNNDNQNTNANSNTNTISNTFNPVNNNDAKINLIVYGGTGNTNSQPTLDGNCTVNPTVAYVNQDVSFYANASGGNGSYSYSWTGTDGISASSQSFGGRFANPGYKSVTVTIRSGSDTITRTCNVTVNAVAAAQSNVTVLRDNTTLGNPVSGVFLNEIPATGISFGLKMTLFTLGLVLWSLFAAYMIARKKGSKATFAEFATAGASTAADKIAAFKLANMAEKGIK